jgi:hypothetical protein
MDDGRLSRLRSHPHSAGPAIARNARRWPAGEDRSVHGRHSQFFSVSSVISWLEPWTAEKDVVNREQRWV